MNKFSALQESLLNSKDIFVTMYGGMAYNPLLTDMTELEQKFTVLKQRPVCKIGEFYLASWDELLPKRTKLLQSKSKQPRIVSVVCK